MSDTKKDNIRSSVRENYGKIAVQVESSCCGPVSCCGDTAEVQHEDSSLDMGYTKADINAVPEGADLGLGCGNPLALASLKTGEVVVDLGSGAGFDCFLAAKQVGGSGKVIGIDMTSEMISKARANAEKGGYGNVEFRLGEIEHLPVADNSADLIISNCVINLSPDKQQVFNDSFRILKTGGRLSVSDIVAVKPLPDSIKSDLSLYTGCISGAALVDDLKEMLKSAGFDDVRIDLKPKSREFIKEWSGKNDISEYVMSADILAVKNG